MDSSTANSSAALTSFIAAKTSEPVLFKFQDLEITRKALVMRFLEERTVIPLREIKSYSLAWFLHDPTFAKKYWFLILAVQLKNGQEESGPIAVAKFNYIDDERESRQHIEGKIAEAISHALSKRSTAQEKVTF